jgi:uncharacterized protein YjeT (DUF2065 family)
MSAVTLILAGIGVWLLVEGALCALAPDFVKRITEQVSRLPVRELALAGLLAAAIGACLVLLAVRTA